MSISTAFFDDEQSPSEINSLDRYTNSTSSFTSWGYVELLSSYLYDSSNALRPIQDKGAICDSFREGKVDLFDRTPKEISLYQRFLRTVDLVGSFTFIHTVLAPIGFFYHTVKSFKYAAQWIRLAIQDERTDGAKQKLHEHAASAIFDLVNGAIPAFAFVAGTATTGLAGGIAAATVATLAFFGKRMIYNDCLAGDLADKIDIYGLHKSIMLKEHFGIVNEKTGRLLSWNPTKDNDVRMNSYSYFGVPSYYREGYFASLYEGQAIELLKAIQSLQTQLPPNCKIPFSYPPKTETILAFLNKNRPISGMSQPEIEAWGKTLDRIEGNIRLIWKIISDGFSASTKEVRHEATRTVYTTYDLIESFPVREEKCREFFDACAN